MSDLRFANLRGDRPLLEEARKEAAALVSVPGPLQDAVDALFAGADASDLL